MRTLRLPLLVIGVAITLVRFADSQVPQLVDVTPAGYAPAQGARDASISADGRFVAFVSAADDLVPGDDNAAADVFLRDRASASIVRVSVATGGAASHPVSTPEEPLCVASPVVSRDGRFVAFASSAPDLVAGDTNDAFDVFVRDVVAGTTERVSVPTSGTQASGESGACTYLHYAGTSQLQQRSTGLAMTPDGRYVAFASLAADIVPGLGVAGRQNVYLHDRHTGVTELVSANPLGGSANAACWFPSISDDGRYVAFDSSASDLVDFDSNDAGDVFVRDRVAGNTFRASIGSGGQQANGPSGFVLEQLDNACSCTVVLPLGSQISADGRCVVFGTRATNLWPAGATVAPTDVFVRDLMTGTTSLVSANPEGTGGSAPSFDPSISADGRYVAFQSSAQDIAATAIPPGQHVFVHDRVMNAARVLSLDPDGKAEDQVAGQPSISADGRQVAFSSSAPLHAADQNDADDVYAWGTAAPAFGEACEGSSITCPCGNVGAPGAGCAHSFEPGGARLQASGSPSLSEDSLALVVIRLVPETGALFVQSSTAFTTATAHSFGDGVRCLAGTVLRLAARQATMDAATLGTAADPRISALGNVPPGGGTRYYQVFYRNISAFCTSSNVNSTNTIRVDWLP